MKLVLTAAAVLVLAASQPVFAAAGWQETKEPGKVTVSYEMEDGTQAKNGWYWLDDDGDGVSECYYFEENGALLISGTAGDGACEAWAFPADGGDVARPVGDGRLRMDAG